MRFRKIPLIWTSRKEKKSNGIIWLERRASEKNERRKVKKREESGEEKEGEEREREKKTDEQIKKHHAISPV